MAQQKIPLLLAESLLAGAEGIEPALPVLETGVLPLNDAPKRQNRIMALDDSQGKNLLRFFEKNTGYPHPPFKPQGNCYTFAVFHSLMPSLWPKCRRVSSWPLSLMRPACPKNKPANSWIKSSSLRMARYARTAS